LLEVGGWQDVACCVIVDSRAQLGYTSGDYIPYYMGGYTAYIRYLYDKYTHNENIPATRYSSSSLRPRSDIITSFLSLRLFLPTSFSVPLNSSSPAGCLACATAALRLRTTCSPTAHLSTKLPDSTLETRPFPRSSQSLFDRRG
jgi:hypothetical protein